MIAGLIAGILGAIALIIVLAVEQHDKETRAREGLPPRKYHDITDHDVTIIHTTQYK